MAATDMYRDFIRRLTACKTPAQTPTALAKTLSCHMAFVGTVPTHEEYNTLLKKAETEFGGDVVGVHIVRAGKSWQALAVYRKRGTLLVVETKPLRFMFGKLFVGLQEFDAEKPGPMPLLFRLTAWLARTVFAVTEAKPFPILHKLAIDQLGLPPSKACFETAYAMPQLLRALDAYVTSVALASTQIDADEASVVDVLHCLGLMYVGSLNEVTSDDEGEHLRATLSLAAIQEGRDHLWWVEDYTLFEENHYNLVVRFNMDSQPVYMKRRLAVADGGKRFQDLETSRKSSVLSWQEGEDEAGMWAMNQWVESMLPPTARAMPYMRHEIIHRYHVLRPRRFLFMTRPYLVNGRPGLLPDLYNASLPPRLFYSPDLFVEPEKIPRGLRPTTVLGEVHVRPWILAEETDIQLFLRFDDHKDHAYRILFTKDGELLPELNRVRIYVESQDHKSLGTDAIQLVVLRRSVGPGGCIVVEFVVTSYCRPFTLCTDSMLCDFTVRLTTFPYDARDGPVVFPSVNLMLWSNRVHMVAEKYNLPPDKAWDKTLRIVRKESRCIVPLIWARPYEDKLYSFSFCEGKDLVKMKPT
jgi:hypothetical protein